jgi:MFS family permease
LSAPVRLSEPAGRWVLVVTAAGSGLVLLEGTVVNVALPALGSDLDASMAGLQWTVNAFTLALSALILLGGALGDRFGRRRVYLVGMVWFGIASLLCGVAPSLEWLVVARALQGVGGALIVPGSLALIQSWFHADRSFPAYQLGAITRGTCTMTDLVVSGRFGTPVEPRTFNRAFTSHRRG